MLKENAMTQKSRMKGSDWGVSWVKDVVIPAVRGGWSDGCSAVV